MIVSSISGPAMDVVHSQHQAPTYKYHHKDIGVVVPPKNYKTMGIAGSFLRPSAASRSTSSGVDSNPAREVISSGTHVDGTTRGKAGEEASTAELEILTKERNEVLDRWADPKTLSLSPEEIELNKFLKRNLKYLFGQTGFDPPVPARNPVSVSMHNPRFAAALWAINTEAYRRKSSVSVLRVIAMIFFWDSPPVTRGSSDLMIGSLGLNGPRLSSCSQPIVVC